MHLKYDPSEPVGMRLARAVYKFSASQCPVMLPTQFHCLETIDILKNIVLPPGTLLWFLYLFWCMYLQILNVIK